MGWRALLEGELAADALLVVHDVAEAIATGAGPDTGIDVPAAHRTVFWAYTCATFDEPFANAAYETAVDDLVAELRSASHAGLFDRGLAGAGWAIAHVLGDELGDALTAVDTALLRSLRAGWTGAYDLTRGLAGIGVYLLERITKGDAPVAREALEVLVAHLADSATRDARGARWFTAANAALRPDWPFEHVDCGLAHGIAGPIAMLAHAAALPDAPAAAAPLCREARRWLCAQRRVGGRSVFPAMVDRAGDSADTRTAWCYGDTGVAAALWLAGATDIARATALSCVARDAEKAGIDDPMMCHGASGLAHMLNRLHQASGEPALGDAARGWYARAIEMRRADSTGHFGAECGFEYPTGDLLNGWMGAALALLAAATPSEPAWDRMFLADLPAL